MYSNRISGKQNILSFQIMVGSGMSTINGTAALRPNQKLQSNHRSGCKYLSAQLNYVEVHTYIRLLNTCDSSDAIWRAKH